MRAPSRLAAGLLLAGLAGLSSCALNVPYDKYAIVYGVSLYDDGLPEGIYPNLTYPNEDADSMEAMLLAQGYTVLKKTNSSGNLTNLLSDITTVAGAAREQDLFLFYFSGHGGYSGTGPEPSGADSSTEWIYLRGSVAPLNLSATLNDDQLVAAFAPIAARKKVIIIDACNSGGFIGNELEADGEPASLVEGSDSIVELAAQAIRLWANFDGSSADIPPWEAIVLSAAGERELSYEMGLPYGHGIFTYYLLEAETQSDQDRDGWVTVTEAFAYATKMIYQDWNYGYGFPSAVFSPHVSGGPVDYVLFEAR